jgi:uncharacterized RDD family membrane protein YckC
MSSMPPPPPPPPPAGGPPPPPYGGSPYGGPPPGYSPYGGFTAASYAGFGSRFFAFFVDGLIGGLFEIPALIAIFAGPRHLVECTVNEEARLCRFPTGATIGLAILLAAVGGIAYLIIYCKMVAKGQSWGHKVANIRIVDANTGLSISAGRVFGRQVARIVSGWVCYLGYLWMLWDSRSQTWHDKIVTTIVIRE